MDLNDLAGKAGELLNQHGDKVEDAVDKVAEIAKEKFGHEEQIDMAADKLKEMIPDGPGAGQAP
ncbi:MT0933-like antitoxin protein [Pseudonocardia thermophila]|jgi:hypothetical protein|uniref:MT0933-like antitoxin protein n=1 Tax=Pseudonocardia thermophila TaxID=1848 RepID=A0A1M6SIK6_PSETH|nr:antitoxin [Pseudonocardia thermophila]SHK44535.1 MT0933-like antitoxin protein [Pseudonocardia thermophila]